MAKFEKQIMLNTGTGEGVQTKTTTSASYVAIGDEVHAYLVTTNYTSATYYFEGVFKVSAGTGTLGIHNTTPTLVTDGEVSTTSTSVTRVRSSAISPSTNTYLTYAKVTGGNTLTYSSSSIIIVQNSDSITATETQYPLLRQSASTSSTSYVDSGTINFSYFRYTSANYDGTVAIYFESTLRNTNGTAYCQLYGGGSAVSSSEVSTTSTTMTRVRSSAISLTNAIDYKPQIKKAGTNAAEINSAVVVIIQTGSISATESYFFPGYNNYTKATTGGSYSATDQYIYYDPAQWSSVTATYTHQATVYSNNATCLVDLYGVTDTAEVTNSEIDVGDNSSTSSQYFSSSLTMPSSAQNIQPRIKTGGTAYAKHDLRVALTWTNGSSGGSFLLNFI